MSEVRLIDANALKEALKSGCENCSDANTNWCEHCCKINDFEDLIDNAPTVDVGIEIAQEREKLYEESKKLYILAKTLGKDERPQGEWEKPFEMNGKTYHKCNHCHISSELILIDKFCPNCGADMRGEKK